MPNDDSITICSVIYKNANFFELNYEFTEQLNQDSTFSWLVVNNQPSEARLNENAEKWRVIEGVSRDSFDSMKVQKYSHHHAAGLKKTFPHLKTRFVLFLDPDFFIVQKGWIKKVTRYMKSKNLSFFGAPWNPKWFGKYRYFPCPHCFFIDLEKVDLKTLDFRPVSHSMKNVMTLWFARRKIGSDFDTGYRIMKKYKSDSAFKHECVTPVFRAKDAFAKHDDDYVGRVIGVEKIASPWNKFLEMFLPENLCFLPKRRGDYSEVGFRELNGCDVSAMQWEEFLWQGEPFGFHLRNFPRVVNGKQNIAEQIVKVKEVLSHFKPDAVLGDTSN